MSTTCINMQKLLIFTEEHIYLLYDSQNIMCCMILRINSDILKKS
jgi:hypothetical protein